MYHVAHGGEALLRSIKKQMKQRLNGRFDQGEHIHAAGV